MRSIPKLTDISNSKNSLFNAFSMKNRVFQTASIFAAVAIISASMFNIGAVAAEHGSNSTNEALYAPGKDVPSDIHPGHWSWEYVKKLSVLNVMSTFRDGTFRGDVEPSALAIVTIIGRVLDRFEDMEQQGLDVPETDFNAVMEILSDFRQEGYHVLRDAETLELEIENLKKRIEELKEPEQLHRSPIQDYMSPEGAYPPDPWTFVKDSQTGIGMLPHEASGVERVSSQPVLTGEFRSTMINSRYGDSDGLSLSNKSYSSESYMEQQLNLRLDFPVDKGVTAHMAMEYGWHRYGAGIGDGGNHTGRFQMKEGYVEFFRPSLTLDGVRIGRQSVQLANWLLFNPVQLDGLRAWKEVNNQLRFDGIMAVYNDVDQNIGANLLIGSASWASNNHLFTFYGAARHDRRSLYNPAGSAFNVITGSHTGAEYFFDGRYERYNGMYGSSYLTAWEAAKSKFYIGAAARGQIHPKLKYHGEIATMHWGENILDPAYPRTPTDVSPQTGGLFGLKWDATDKMGLKLSARKHDRYFEPLTAGQTVFANNQYDEAEFGEDKETSWEELGYTRDFTELFARLEYNPGKRDQLWLSYENIQDNRSKLANELADDTIVKSAGLRRWYSKDTYFELSWHLFDGTDVRGLPTGTWPVGASARTATTPRYNIHTGLLPGRHESDQSLLRLRFNTRFE